MEPGNWAAIFIATVAAIGSWLSHKASSHASIRNSDNESRVEMEKEAYERARKLDTETITRQDDEMSELRTENLQLRKDNEALHAEIRELKARIINLERRVLSVEGTDDNSK